MNKHELSAHVAARSSLSKSDIDAAVNAVFSPIADALAHGDSVRIAGFGTDSTRSHPTRRDRNTRTSERIAIGASNTPSLKADKALRDAVK